jgi:hypothetical protein
MATEADTEIARLTTRLSSVMSAIERIENNGQAWRKGGSQGFAATQADLPDLYKQEHELRAKLAMWGVYNV